MVGREKSTGWNSSEGMPHTSLAENISFLSIFVVAWRCDGLIVLEDTELISGACHLLPQGRDERGRRVSRSRLALDERAVTWSV